MRNLRLAGCLALASVALGTAACGPRPQDDDLRAGTPPPASALVALGESPSLDTALVALETELTGLLADRMESSTGDEHLVRAEAISDRLLETDVPFDRTADDAYSVEAILRQIQTLADRLVAQRQVARQFGSTVDREDILRDARDLLRRVRGLREDLAAGGTDAPVPLDRLLAGDSTASRAAPRPAAPAGPAGPVGTPVQAADTSAVAGLLPRRP